MTARAAVPRVLLGLVIAGSALWLFVNRERLDPALLETAVRDLGPCAPLAHIALFTLATLLRARRTFRPSRSAAWGYGSD